MAFTFAAPASAQQTRELRRPIDSSSSTVTAGPGMVIPPSLTSTDVGKMLDERGGRKAWTKYFLGQTKVVDAMYFTILDNGTIFVRGSSFDGTAYLNNITTNLPYESNPATATEQQYPCINWSQVPNFFQTRSSSTAVAVPIFTNHELLNGLPPSDWNPSFSHVACSPRPVDSL